MRPFEPPSDLTAEMLAFEDSMRGAFDYTPERNPDGDWESAYVNPRDSDRFAGWLLRRPPGERPAGEPANGARLLDHCRAYEMMLSAMLAYENAIAAQRGEPVRESTIALDMVRASIKAAVASMKR